MALDFFKKKGRNLAFSIALKPPIPYPSQEIRWKIYGAPLMRIFTIYFDEGSIQWYKDSDGKLDALIVVCYGAKFSYKENEEFTYIGRLFQTLSSEVESFFNQFKTKATIIDLIEPVPKTLKDYSMSIAVNKDNPEKIKDKLYRSIDYPQAKYDYQIFKCKENGKAIEMAKKFFKEVVVDKGIKDMRISQEHPNVIENKDEKTGKWKAYAVFIDSITTYTPKGEKEHFVEFSKSRR